MSKNFKILLVGCGQLGSRHLQAVACLKEVREIHVVDPNPQSILLGKERLRTMSGVNRKITFEWHAELNKVAAGGDLCIVATQAKGRSELIQKIAERFIYKNFLIEKIVCPSIKEYQSLLLFQKQKKISIWVNCQTRTFDVHQYIKSCVNPSEPITFSAVGGNYGLACNGIHYADLFAFYTDADRIECSGSRIDPVLYPSKRGKDIWDLSGTLLGNSKNRSDFILSFSALDNDPDVVTIATPHRRFMIDHLRKFAYECRAGSKWKKLIMQGDYFVSQTSQILARDILVKGKCALPTLKECFPAHEFILKTLQPHFNRLLGVNRDYCPVT